MKRGFSLEAKVGLFIILVLILMAWISLKLGNVGIFGASGYTVSARFDTAAGLDPESKVLLAGLRVGRIKSISVEEGRALVRMHINEGTDLPADSRVKIQSQGLLGQKYLDIKPGDPQAGLLADGDFFTQIDQPVELTQLTDNIYPIIENLTAITQSLKLVIDNDAFRGRVSAITGNVEDSTEVLARILIENQANLARMIANLESLTGVLSDSFSRNEEGINRTLEALPVIAEGLAEVADRLAQVMEKGGEDATQTLAQLREATDRLTKALDSVGSIARKVDEGEGTLGALVNERETIDDLAEAVSGLNEFLSRAKRTKLAMSYDANYLFDADVTKHYLSLALWPKPNQYYMVGMVADDYGRTSTTNTHKEVVTNPGANNEKTTITEETKSVNRDTYRFTAQIARRYWDFVIRGGLIEGDGGAGADYLLWDDRIKFSFEAFDFDKETNPHLKALASARFLNNFVITGGVDDFIDSGHDPYWFIGAGLSISDDDIKSIISILPVSQAF